MNKKILLMLFSFLIWPLGASANTGLQGFDLGLYRKFSENASVLAPRHFGADLYFEYAHGLLATQNTTTLATQRIVEDLWLGRFGARLGLGAHFQAGLQVPVYFLEKGQNDTSGTSYSQAAFGDLSVDLKWAPFENKLPFGLALDSILSFPTGSQESFSGNGTVSAEFRLIADKTFGPFETNAYAGYQVRPKIRVAGTLVDDALPFGVGMAFTLPVADRSLDLITSIDGRLALAEVKSLNSPVAWLAGLQKRFCPFSIKIAGGSSLTDGIGAGEWRIVTQLSYDGSAPKETQARIETPQTAPVLVVKELIPFRFNQSDFQPWHQATLEQVALRLREDPQLKCMVNGHSDSEGSPELNLDVSKQRAHTVAEALRLLGVDEGRINVAFFGDTQPVSENQTLEGKSRNRRVEIWLTR